MKIKQEQCDIQEVENDKNNINNSGAGGYNNANNGGNVVPSTTEHASDQDTERFVVCYLFCVIQWMTVLKNSGESAVLITLHGIRCSWQK